MTAVGEWRATYAPGDSLVLCGPTSVVVLEPPGTGWTALVAELWEQVLAASSLRDLAARLAAYGLDTMPSFGALFWTPDGMRSLVRGGVRVVDPATGEVVADGEGVQTWSETGLAALSTARVETAVEDDPDALLLPLVVGVVRASSVVLDARTEAQVASPQADPGGWASGSSPSRSAGPGDAPDPDAAAGPDHERAEDSPAAAPSRTERGTDPVSVPLVLPTTEPLAPPTGPEPDGPAGALELADGDEPTEPQPELGATGPQTGAAPKGPTVLGVVCPNGHANPPGAGRCRDCGERISDSEPRSVPQPVLATLRVTDGTQVALDGLVRIGRAPVEREDIVARLLTVPSPSHDISRTHLEIAPEGWRVMVCDLNSTNGTILVSPDGVHRRPLPPGQSVPVALGSVLELADGVSVLLDLPQ